MMESNLGQTQLCLGDNRVGFELLGRRCERSGLRIIVATVENEKAVTIGKTVPSNMLRILPVCLR